MPINQSERERAKAETDKGTKFLLLCNFVSAFLIAEVFEDKYFERHVGWIQWSK